MGFTDWGMLNVPILYEEFPYNHPYNHCVQGINDCPYGNQAFQKIEMFNLFVSSEAATISIPQRDHGDLLQGFSTARKACQDLVEAQV